MIGALEGREVFTVTEELKDVAYERVDGEFKEISVQLYSTYQLSPTDKFKQAQEKYAQAQSNH